MIVVCLYQCVPQIAVRRIAYAVNRLEAGVDRLTEPGNGHKAVCGKFDRLARAFLKAQCLAVFELQHSIDIRYILCIAQSDLRAFSYRNIIKQGAFRLVFFKNKTEFLLLGKLVHFIGNALPQLGIFYLLNQFI